MDQRTNSRTQRPPTVPSLTGIRFLAALAVVLFHYRVLLHYPPWLMTLSEAAKAAVSLFFLLSGFVLALNYRGWFQSVISAAPYWQFFRARFARVYPMHVAALVLITPVVLYFVHRQPEQFGRIMHSGLSPRELTLSWLANLFLAQVYLPNLAYEELWNVPSWSIACEFVFYALFPFFVVLFLRPSRKIGFLVTLVAVLFMIETAAIWIAIRVVESVHSPLQFWLMDFIVYRLPLLRVWEFFIGCTLGAIFLETYTHRSFILRSSINRTLALVVALTVISLSVMAGCITKESAPWLEPIYWYLVYTPPFGLLLLTLAYGPTFLSPVLEHPWMLLLGEASYSLYILHFIPATLFTYLQNTGLDPGLPASAASIFACIVLSLLFYQYVEMPLRQALRGRPREPKEDTLPSQSGRHQL